MAPRKRKSSKTALEEEEKPEISLDFSEELEMKIKRAEELAKAEKTEKKDKQKGDEASGGNRIKQNINKVKAKEGVIGYILRNATSANIDLKDPTKVIDYAVLSSSAFEASEELSNTFELGDIKHVVVEGNVVRLLSFTDKETKVSVFMEKTVDYKRIYKDLLS